MSSRRAFASWLLLGRGQPATPKFRHPYHGLSGSFRGHGRRCVVRTQMRLAAWTVAAVCGLWIAPALADDLLLRPTFSIGGSSLIPTSHVGQINVGAQGALHLDLLLDIGP